MFTYFGVWLAAAVVMTLVFVFSKNMNQSSTVLPKSDPEQELLDKLYKLDHECDEMQGVLLEYNSDYNRQIYWDLLAEKTQAELEWQNKYCYSRKVLSFKRV